MQRMNSQRKEKTIITFEQFRKNKDTVKAKADSCSMFEVAGITT